jgi:hypothetical protein
MEWAAPRRFVELASVTNDLQQIPRPNFEQRLAREVTEPRTLPISVAVVLRPSKRWLSSWLALSIDRACETIEVHRL